MFRKTGCIDETAIGQCTSASPFPMPAAFEDSEPAAERSKSYGVFRKKAEPQEIGAKKNIQGQAHTQPSEEGRNEASVQRPTMQSSKRDASAGERTGAHGDKRQIKICYDKYGENPNAVLRIVSSDIPEPASDKDVVIKISASTISANDCLNRRGISFNVMDSVSLPSTPGRDVVGYIIKVGLRVKHHKVGDRVAALVRTGGNARYVSVPASDLVEVPRSCDAAEAACMVATYMTAYQALRMVTKDQFTLNGKRILITGGIEPVGQALIQLCFRAGAEEVYATAPVHRHRYIKSVLRARPLPFEPAEWLPKTKGGMDVVFDGACHDGRESPHASLKPEGVLVCVGMSALLNKGNAGVFGAPISAYWTNLKGQFMANTKTYEVWESFKANPEAFKLDLEILFHLLKKRFIKPHIAKRVALTEVAEAQAILEQETARGEIVCLPWKRSSVKVPT